MTTMVTIRTYGDLTEAQIAAAFLRRNDITVFLPDEHLLSTAWAYQHAVGGMRLQVPRTEVEAARALLMDVDGEGRFPAIGE